LISRHPEIIEQRVEVAVCIDREILASIPALPNAITLTSREVPLVTPTSSPQEMIVVVKDATFRRYGFPVKKIDLCTFQKKFCHIGVNVIFGYILYL